MLFAAVALWGLVRPCGLPNRRGESGRLSSFSSPGSWPRWRQCALCSTGRAKAFWMGCAAECILPVFIYFPVVVSFSINGTVPQCQRSALVLTLYGLVSSGPYRHIVQLSPDFDCLGFRSRRRPSLRRHALALGPPNEPKGLIDADLSPLASVFVAWLSGRSDDRLCLRWAGRPKAPENVGRRLMQF